MAPLLAPEVEALLVEMAADPSSHLLRAPRGRALPTRAPTAAVASGNEPFLTLAERQLARVHREEVASTLTRMAALAALRRPELAGTLIVLRAPERPTVAEAALRLLAVGAAQGEEPAAREALARGADASDEGDAWEPARLLSIALRLAHPRGALQWWPLVLAATGHGHAAWTAALELEQEAVDPFARAIAASNVGLAAWRLGHHADAADAYGRAFRARPAEALYLAFHQLNVYLAALEGRSVALIAEPFPAGVDLAAFLRRALVAAPVPGWQRRVELARAQHRPPKLLEPVAEVVRGLAR